jgi:hypothetical protein
MKFDGEPSCIMRALKRLRSCAAMFPTKEFHVFRVTNGLSALALAAFLSACGYKDAAPVNDVSVPAVQPNLALAAQTAHAADDGLPTVVVSAKRSGEPDRS